MFWAVPSFVLMFCPLLPMCQSVLAHDNGMIWDRNEARTMAWTLLSAEAIPDAENVVGEALVEAAGVGTAMMGMGGRREACHNSTLL